MCDEKKYPSLPQGGDPVQFSTCSDDPVLPDDVDREQASRSSLENCEVPSDNSYLPGSESASLIAPENQYYEKLIGIDADSSAYPEDLIMIGSSVDVRDDSKPLLLSEEPAISSDSCNNDSSGLTSKCPSSQSEKTIMVMPEDIEAAGLSMQNLNDLTEAQFNTLVAIAERRQRSSEQPLTPRNQYAEQIDSNCASTDSLTMVITDDGSLKLTDATGQMLVFDRTQLAALRIDVNNLTDESIQQIVQLAMPAISVGSKSTGTSKTDLQRSSRLDPANLDRQGSDVGFKCSDGSVAQTSQRVEERNSAQERNASVRYVKNGRWKVQYEDGRFEWIGEDSVNLCETKAVQHSDHSGYHAGSTPDQAHSSMLTSSPRIKRSCSSDSSFDGIPTLKRRGPIQAPNFCCPVCDRKVYQKEPSYIVIRLPACDDCTKGKMIVLDERAKRLCLPTRRK